MGIKDTINAVNRYAENADIFDKVHKGKIEHFSPEDDQQWNYFIASNAGEEDIGTIYHLAAKSLRANGKEVNVENLRHFFDALVQTYEPEQSSSPEQIQDLEKEFGTQGDNSDTGTPYQSREDVPESARDLWDIMHNDEAINSMRRGM